MEIPHEDQSSHYDHEKDKFAYLSMRDRIELGKRQVQQSQWGSKYALNEGMSMKAKLASMARRIEGFELRNVHTEAQPQAMPTSFEYINHPNLTSQPQHQPNDKFAYLSMRGRIELGKRQVQQSQWGRECPTIPTVRDMYGYQSSYTSSWNNHPNLTTKPQPQPSMSTSSLEQAILKISKVMEDFVGEQQKINSHLNEKIDNLESSINVKMEGVYNDLSLRIEKVQDSIEKLTNLDIARGKRKLPPQPHHNLQGTNAKRSRKVLKIDTLVGDCYDNSMDQPSIENHKVQDDKGYDACKNRNGGETEETGEPKCISKALSGISHHEHTQWFNLLNSKSTSHEVPLPSSLFSIQTLRTMFISVGGRDEETSQAKERSKEKVKKIEDSSCSLPSHFWSTFRSLFSTCYIPFQSSGSQESNAYRLPFGAEMRKIWPSEDNCSRLVRNSHNTFSLCEIRTTPSACAKLAQHLPNSHSPCVVRIFLCSADSTLDLFF
uniref:Uncharacterized protein n=1 Tax=Vitis vinifera TaxID=29760 RepID=A5AGR8_VITVI|nr:hypothetical protein VITISV_003910 [Vitis vinifera]